MKKDSKPYIAAASPRTFQPLRIARKFGRSWSSMKWRRALSTNLNAKSMRSPADGWRSPAQQLRRSLCNRAFTTAGDGAAGGNNSAAADGGWRTVPAETTILARETQYDMLSRGLKAQRQGKARSRIGRGQETINGLGARRAGRNALNRPAARQGASAPQSDK